GWTSRPAGRCETRRRDLVTLWYKSPANPPSIGRFLAPAGFAKWGPAGSRDRSDRGGGRAGQDLVGPGPDRLAEGRQGQVVAVGAERVLHVLGGQLDPQEEVGEQADDRDGPPAERVRPQARGREQVQQHARAQ